MYLNSYLDVALGGKRSMTAGGNSRLAPIFPRSFRIVGSPNQFYVADIMNSWMSKSNEWC